MLFLFSIIISFILTYIVYKFYFKKNSSSKKQTVNNKQNANVQTKTKLRSSKSDEVSDANEQSNPPEKVKAIAKELNFKERVENIFDLLSNDEIDFKTKEAFKKEMAKAKEKYINEEGLEGNFIPFESLIVLTRNLHPIVRPDGSVMVKCYSDNMLNKIPIREDNSAPRTENYIQTNVKNEKCGEIESSSRDRDEDYIDIKDDTADSASNETDNSDKETPQKNNSNRFNNSINTVRSEDFPDAYEVDDEEGDVTLSNEAMGQAEENNFVYIKDCDFTNDDDITLHKIAECILSDYNKTTTLINNLFVENLIYRDTNNNYYISQDDFEYMLKKSVNMQNKNCKILYKEIKKIIQQYCEGILTIFTTKDYQIGDTIKKNVWMSTINNRFILKSLHINEERARKITKSIKMI